jgi:hypothetical protein
MTKATPFHRLTADAATLDRQLAFETLTAAATDLDRRTISGLVIPYNVPGRTSRGMVAVAAGALTWPTDLGRIKLTLDHDRSRPLGPCIALEARADGIHGTFRIGTGAAGDTALLEASEGVRDGLSVDLVDVELAGDQLTAGEIAAVGLCAVPAYGDARVDQVAATANDDPTTPPAATSPSTPPPAIAPTSTVSRRSSSARTTPRTGEASLVAAAAAIAATARGDMSPAQLTAVLSDFTTDPASGGAALPPQWVGALWAEADVARPHIEAVTGPRPLTSLKVQGWQWITTLKVDKYAGNKVQIPTNAPTLGPAEEIAQRWAGGVDVDRAFIDLGSGDVVRDMLVQATNDYRAKTDLDCLDALLTGATDLPVSADAIAAVSDVYAAFRAIRVRPSTVWMSADLFEALANMPGPAALYGAGSISGDSGQINGRSFEYDPDLPDGNVLGIAKAAATFYEKGPLNVNALDIAKGGVDEAVFGYTATLINRAAAVVNATVAVVPLGTSGASTSTSK